MSLTMGQGTATATCRKRHLKGTDRSDVFYIDYSYSLSSVHSQMFLLYYMTCAVFMHLKMPNTKPKPDCYAAIKHTLLSLWTVKW